MAGTEEWKNHLEQWKNQLEPWKNQLEQWLNQGVEYIKQIPPTQLYAAIAVLLFTTLLLLSSIMLSHSNFVTILLSSICSTTNLVFYFSDVSLCMTVRLFKRTKSNTIVLTGLSGSGKTVLFHQVNIGIVAFSRWHVSTCPDLNN